MREISKKNNLDREKYQNTVVFFLLFALTFFFSNIMHNHQKKKKQKTQDCKIKSEDLSPYTLSAISKCQR